MPAPPIRRTSGRLLTVRTRQWARGGRCSRSRPVTRSGRCRAREGRSGPDRQPRPPSRIGDRAGSCGSCWAMRTAQQGNLCRTERLEAARAHTKRPRAGTGGRPVRRGAQVRPARTDVAHEPDLKWVSARKHRSRHRRLSRPERAALDDAVPLVSRPRPGRGGPNLHNERIPIQNTSPSSGPYRRPHCRGCVRPGRPG